MFKIQGILESKSRFSTNIFKGGLLVSKWMNFRKVSNGPDDGEVDDGLDGLNGED